MPLAGQILFRSVECSEDVQDMSLLRRFETGKDQLSCDVLSCVVAMAMALEEFFRRTKTGAN